MSEDAGVTPDTDTAGATPADDDAPLNEGGMRALQRERDARREAERSAKELQSRLDRLEVAAAKGVPADMLTGDDREAMEVMADRLVAYRGGHTAAANHDRMRRPTERLTPGAAPTTTPDKSPDQIADDVLRGR